MDTDGGRVCAGDWGGWGEVYGGKGVLWNTLNNKELKLKNKK